MASLRKIKNSYFVRFRLAGREFERDVRSDPAQAEAKRKRVEATVLDIKNGRTKLPDDADIAQSRFQEASAWRWLRQPR